MGTFYIKEDDTSPRLQVALKNPDGTATGLNDTTVRIRIAKARGGANILDAEASIDDATGGVVSYQFSDGLDEGRYRVEFEVDFGAAETETFPNKGYHTLMVGRNMEV